MSTKVLKAKDSADASRIASEAAEAVRAGGLVGFATETVYGIAALATKADAMARLRELKSRPTRPFSVHIAQPADVYRYVRREHVCDLARRLIEKALPGPITLLLPVSMDSASSWLKDKTLYTRLVAIEGRDTAHDNPQSEIRDPQLSPGVIGLRCPDLSITQEMLSLVDGPVVAPSANLSGKASPRTASDVLEDLDGKIDLLIDSGPTRYGKDSTIVNFASESWSIVRAGVYDERAVRHFMTRTFLFVCTGNTCRSPMAAALARKILAEKLGVQPFRLGEQGVQVHSAGVYGGNGSPATPEAVEAVRKLGGDLSGHRSRKLTMQLIHEADMVFCMTDFHVEQVLEMAPEAKGKVCRLREEGEIADPIGGVANVYGRTAAQIQEAILKRFAHVGEAFFQARAGRKGPS